jgi:hypothetical protein
MITRIVLLHKNILLAGGLVHAEIGKAHHAHHGAVHSVHFSTARPGYRPLITYNISKTKILLSDQQSRYVSRDMLVLQLRTSASTLISSTQQCCP